MPLFRVLAAHAQAVRYRLDAYRMAIGAVPDAIVHFSRAVLSGVVRHGLAPPFVEIQSKLA
jgi:hypothetical protein